jgi:hypothetical protein
MRSHDGLDYSSNKRREPFGHCIIPDPIPLNPMIEKKKNQTIHMLKCNQRSKRDVICQTNSSKISKKKKKKLGSQL